MQDIIQIEMRSQVQPQDPNLHWEREGHPQWEGDCGCMIKGLPLFNMCTVTPLPNLSIPGTSEHMLIMLF